MIEKKELLKRLDDLATRLDIMSHIKQALRLVDKLEQDGAPKDVPGQKEFGFAQHKSIGIAMVPLSGFETDECNKKAPAPLSETEHEEHAKKMMELRDRKDPYINSKLESLKALQSVLDKVKKEPDSQAAQRRHVAMLSEKYAANYARYAGQALHGPLSMLKPPQNRSGFWDYVAGFEEGYKHGQKDASDLFSAVEAAKATKGTEPCSPAVESEGAL